jgi:hypothetical protein
LRECVLTFTQLLSALQRFGINMATVDVDYLIEEAIPEGQEALTFDVFCTIVQQVLRT